MKQFCAVLLVLLLAIGFAQIKVTGGDTGAFGKASKIEPGSFGYTEFYITLIPGKNGKMLVGGRREGARSFVSITGNLLANNKLLAKLLDGPQTPIDGRYNPDNDTIVITRIGNHSETEVLKRMNAGLKGGKGPIQPGLYSGRSDDPEGEWEVTVSKTTSADFNVSGSITIGEKKIPLKGILRKGGTLAGYGGPDEDYKMDGTYDFVTKDIKISIKGNGMKATAFLSPGRLAPVPLFGLVSKEVGNVPGPGGDGNGTVEGGISEDMFFIELKKRPPEQGRTKVTHHYSTTMGSTLKQGQIIELKCWSDGEQEGPYPPLIGSGAFWMVEGDAKTLELKKTYAGFASDGKFYARSEGITRFQVGGSGTIKITAVQGGQLWGSSTNWNPCTYIYKFREPAKTSVGGG